MFDNKKALELKCEMIEKKYSVELLKFELTLKSVILADEFVQIIVGNKSNIKSAIFFEEEPTDTLSLARNLQIYFFLKGFEVSKLEYEKDPDDTLKDPDEVNYATFYVSIKNPREIK